jgi:hypothetical protein
LGSIEAEEAAEEMIGGDEAGAEEEELSAIVEL